MKNNISCTVCGNKESVSFFDDKRRLARCSLCDHAFTTEPHQNTNLYSEKYYKEIHKNWFENPDYRFFEYIWKKINALNLKKNAKVLDVGCGRGDFLKFIREKNNHLMLVGVDFSCDDNTGFDFLKGDIMNVNTGMEFDVVTSFQTVEHVENPNTFTQKLYSELKPGGVALIATINSGGLFYGLARFLKKLGINVAYNRLYSIHHLQHYTNKSLHFLLEKNGFMVTENRNYNYPLKAVDTPSASPLMKKLYYAAIGIIFFLSNLMGNGILQVVICQKKQKEA